MQAALPALLLALGGLSEGGEASFWPSSLTASSRAPSTPWDEAPCVDLDWQCEEHAGAGLCLKKPERMSGCCSACAAETTQEELLGCPPQTERMLRTLEAQVRENCLQGPDWMYMATECTTATRTTCRNSLDQLTVLAKTPEGAECNAYMFANYADIAVYWAACHDRPAAETVEVRTAQELGGALGGSALVPIKVVGDYIDYADYYDPQRDIDCDLQIRPQEECLPAIRVDSGRPMQISGRKPTIGVLAALRARFFVFYGTLSMRMLRLVEQPCAANVDPPYGSVIMQRGGQITIHECVFETTSPFIYGPAGRAIYTDRVGDILIRSSRLVLPDTVEARDRGLTTCTRPPNTPALGDTQCVMEIDELFISDAEFVATGASQMVGSCPSGTARDSETMKCVYGSEAVKTECLPGSKLKIDAVSGKEVPGHCVIETVECPSGSTLSSADGKKCIWSAVESPASNNGPTGDLECPAGSERQGDTCVYTNAVCQTGSSLRMDADGKQFCVIDTPPGCPDGSSLAEPADAAAGSVRCILDSTECPAGSTAATDGTCVKDEAQCPQCKPRDAPPAPPVAACPAGSELVGDSCLITAVRCPDGATMDKHGTCVQQNVQFRATFDESSELFPCKLGLLDALIARGFLVSLMSALKSSLPGCGIDGDRLCVALFTVAVWKSVIFVWKFCKCNKLCRKHKKPPSPTEVDQYQPYPERVLPGMPLEQPYMPFQPTRGLLKVTHISCHDLIAADENGKSDPYAVLKLSDREGRSINAQEQKTKVQYETLHPKFSERFQFHINASTILPDLDIKLMDNDRATFDDHLGQAKIDLHSFFNSRGDWTTTLGPTTVTFDLADPEKLVADEHMREREELLRQRGDFDSAAQLGTVTVTMEYVPQRSQSPKPRGGGSPRRLDGTFRHTSRSPGRSLTRNQLHHGRLEAQKEAAARLQRTSRSRSPRSVRSRSTSRSARLGAGSDWRAWYDETATALDGKWTAVGGDDEDFVELYLHDDLSITGRHLDTLGPDADPAVIEDGVLHPPRQTRGNGAVESGPGSPGWLKSFELRRDKNAGPVELGTVSFVQRFRDNEVTRWTATLYSSESSGSSPFMDGQWSGACDGSFHAEKENGGRRRMAGVGLDGSISAVHVNASSGSLMHDYGNPRTPSYRASPGRRTASGAVALPKGTLTVKLLRAQSLIAADTSGNIPNCYGKLQLVDQAGKSLSEVSKTPTLTNVRDPEFNYLCTFHIDGAGSGSPSSRIGGAPTLQVTMMDKGTFSDSFLGRVSIDMGELFGDSSKIAAGIMDTIEDTYALEDAPDQTVNKEYFARRMQELASGTHSEGQHENPHGYVRLAITLTPDQM